MSSEKEPIPGLVTCQQDLPVYREHGRALGVCFEHITVVGAAAGENTVRKASENLVSAKHSKIK